MEKVKTRKGYNITDTNEINSIISSFLESLYSSNVENLEEMNTFLDTLDLPQLNKEDINNL